MAPFKNLKQAGERAAVVNGVCSERRRSGIEPRIVFVLRRIDKGNGAAR